MSCKPCLDELDVGLPEGGHPVVTLRLIKSSAEEERSHKGCELTVHILAEVEARVDVPGDLWVRRVVSKTDGQESQNGVRLD